MKIHQNIPEEANVYQTVDWSQQVRLSKAGLGCISMVFFA
jgi:hypothetical protein